MPGPKPRVSIINSNEEIVLALRELMDDEGFDASTAHVFDFKTGKLSIVDFVKQWEPEVIVYDVAPPYDSNWHYLQQIRALPVMQGRAFVITSTNKKALLDMAGANVSIEILGKPEDMLEILAAVKRALRRASEAA